MNDTNWSAFGPEIFLLIMACLVAVFDLFVKHPKRLPTYVLTQISLLVVGVWHLVMFEDGQTVYAAQRMIVSDPMGHLLAFFATIAIIVTLSYARSYASSRDILKGELFSLSMFSLLGTLVMLSANNFLVVYLGLELMSLALYALSALRRDHGPATEAAMKYFVLGALASGFLLYGLSMMYGATGSLDLGEVFRAVETGTLNNQVMVYGVVFVVAGLAFKLGAAPFHMWVPDVYQGTPTAVTLLIAGAPKISAFAITVRLLIEGMLGVAADWQQMLVVLSIASIGLGNLVAITQTNLKRMLAYSSIAQMGFMLLGLCSGVINDSTTPAVNAYSSAMFYVVTYVLTTLGSFGLIMLMSRAGFEAEEVSDLRGLAKRSPWFAAVMAIFMLSLAGLPPTVGFYAKLAVLQALITTNDGGYIWLAVIAVIFSVIGAFYYLRAIKVMYFDEPVDTAPLESSGEARALLSLNGLAVLVFGLVPGGLMTMCAQAVLKTLAS